MSFPRTSESGRPPSGCRYRLSPGSQYDKLRLTGGINLDQVRIHYRFYGQVQGVGFRYRASHAAGLWGVTGWIRNDWDGSVEMELQGSLSSIGKVLSSLAASPYICIDRMERSEIPVIPETGFSVRG